MRTLITFLLLLLAADAAMAQATKEYAVQINATTQVAPPRITLSWRKINAGTPVYQVFRKSLTGTSWGSAIGAVGGGDTVYVDNSVIVDSAYEYQVVAGGTGLSPIPQGYIYAGIKAPAIHNRGTLVLIVDTLFRDSCAAELTTLMKDINGDGWAIERHDFSRTTPDTVIKTAIRNDYNNIPDIKAVLIVGHVAVPYSGDMNPDAHADHKGGWPADVFYGSITGVWTDASVNNATSANMANHNVPGDGKWDHTLQPLPMELEVSRIDVWNMPAFASTEVQRMRRYLDKAHTYKMDQLPMRKRGVITDNFGMSTGEPFAGNGWRNFAPMVSYDSVYELPFINSLKTGQYQWAFGCGGGSYTSASGVGTTTDFVNARAQHGIFTMLFGSYFGDWNYTNSFLRAPLCVDTPALTCCWAGRPHWFMHHMALGHDIGYSTRLSQNNGLATTLYQPTGFYPGGVHMALMGDLTLRTDYIQPVPTVNASVISKGANVTWTASPDAAVMGYYVYRTDSLWGHYARISPMVTGLSFNDTVGVDGLKYYMVRPVKLQQTPSGGYYNLGVGVTDTLTVNYPEPTVGAPIMAGHLPDVQVFPNPTENVLNVTINTVNEELAGLCLVNMAGERFYPAKRQLRVGQNAYSIDVSALPPGNYLLYVETGGGTAVRKWTKL